VVAQDGRLVGLSTDGDGVLVPLRRRVDPAGRTVAIVGAGVGPVLLAPEDL
jgi:shikimate 5-dehydrogenase